MQRVDGQTLSPQADKHSGQPSQCSMDGKPLHMLPSINSGLLGHLDKNTNVTVVTAKGVCREAGKQEEVAKMRW